MAVNHNYFFVSEGCANDTKRLQVFDATTSSLVKVIPMSKDTSQTTSRDSHLHVTNEFALLEVNPEAKRFRSIKNMTSIYLMDGEPEEWSNDGADYLVNHTIQVELKADKGIYYVSQKVVQPKRAFYLHLNQYDGPEKAEDIMKMLPLESDNQNFKFTYDSYRDEVIFVIFNIKDKTVDV